MSRKNPFVSYNAFLRAAKSRENLTHGQAQTLYRGLKDHLDKIPRAADLSRHPRITAQEKEYFGLSGGGPAAPNSPFFDEDVEADYGFEDFDGDEDTYGQVA